LQASPDLALRSGRGRYGSEDYRMQNAFYRKAPPGATTNLNERHRRTLVEGSAIAPEVIAERGYYSARTRSDVPECFPHYQRRLGLVIPGLTVEGLRRYRLRPDRPRKDKKGKPQKYEHAQGQPCYLDTASPRNLTRVKEPAVPLWICEGEKKQDALISQGECAISIAGVWNYQRDGELLPDWEHIPLEGRTVYACFDSDAWRNPNVALALSRMIRMLSGRGARVLTVVLEDAPDGSKIGADDAISSGATADDLKAHACKLAPEDVATERLSRDEQLRGMVADLSRRFWRAEWRGMGGHSERDVCAVLVLTAPSRGRAVKGGVEVPISWGELELRAKVSRRTLAKCIARLEGRGVIAERVKADKPDRSGGFLLRASVYHYGESDGGRGASNSNVTKVLPSGLHLRGPRLRWSSPGYNPRRGMVRGTRRVRQSKPPAPRPTISRPGKLRCHVTDALEQAGGALGVSELAAELGINRPRALTRRKRTDKGRDGLLIWYLDAGIIALEDGVVSLAADWLQRVQNVREAGGEIEAGRLAARRMADKRRAWREHVARKQGRERPRPKPGHASVANIAASRAKRREHLERQERGRAAREDRERAAAEGRAKRKRVEQLVREGMKRRFAEEDVYGRHSEATQPQAASEATQPRERRLARKVNGVYVHGQECGCWICGEEVG
jgi:hypothetical protein